MRISKLWRWKPQQSLKPGWPAYAVGEKGGENVFERRESAKWDRWVPRVLTIEAADWRTWPLFRRFFLVHNQIPHSDKFSSLSSHLWTATHVTSSCKGNAQFKRSQEDSLSNYDSEMLVFVDGVAHRQPG